MKSKAYEGAYTAFKALNPEGSRVDWESRIAAAISVSGDDGQVILQDCERCLASGVLGHDDEGIRAVRDSWVYFKTTSEIVDELARDESIVLA